MAELNTFYANWTPRILSVLRIITGFLFIWHGSQKFFNYPPDTSGLMPNPLPAIIIVAAVMEVVGGLFILFGLFTRPVAFLLSGLMAAAYFMGHASGGFLPLQTAEKLQCCIVSCFYISVSRAEVNGVWIG